MVSFLLQLLLPRANKWVGIEVLDRTADPAFMWLLYIWLVGLPSFTARAVWRWWIITHGQWTVYVRVFFFPFSPFFTPWGSAALVAARQRNQGTDSIAFVVPTSCFFFSPFSFFCDQRPEIDMDPGVDAAPHPKRVFFFPFFLFLPSLSLPPDRGAQLQEGWSSHR